MMTDTQQKPRASSSVSKRQGICLLSSREMLSLAGQVTQCFGVEAGYKWAKRRLLLLIAL